MPEDDVVGVEEPRGQGTDGLKSVEGAGGEVQKPGEDGKAVLDDTEEEDVDVNESEDSRDEDEDPDMECDGDDAGWVPSRQEAEGAGEQEEAPAGSSSSQRKAAGQGLGSTGANEEGATAPWLDESTEDHLPPQPEFQPLRTPGPQIAQLHTALQLFRLFFTDTMLTTVLRNTNKYGAIHHTDQWSDVTLPDLFSYMSMVIYKGLTQLPTSEDYWKRSKPYNLPFPRSVITRKKFTRISTTLCMSDPDDDAANDARRGTLEYDCLQKIKPMYTELRQACKTNFHPYQDIRVDERAMYKLREKKGCKFGYKMFFLTDSRCGYIWDFHMGENRTAFAAGYGLNYHMVMGLLSTEVLGSGYKLYLDSFYNCPELFKDLLQKKIWACGTIGPRCKGFPSTNRPGSLDKKSPRGAIRWIREDPLLFVQWRDNCDVQMCSTMHQAHAGETVQRKVPVNRVNGKWTTEDIPIPPAVKDYNTHMGGADLPDDVIGSFSLRQRSLRWHRTVFFNFMDIAIDNAFILQKWIALSKGETPQTQKVFREDLLIELSEAGSQPTPRLVTPPSSKHGNGMHLPVYFSGDSTLGRKRCCVCRQRTPIMCKVCDRCFCCVPKRNCFTKWHSENLNP
ncbi:piggyBac transposable element-derived protein 4-like [Engraulis encrasicolus]|uniref:piggyBac transposable element-derived protein 4-like n=1 Tax=Engraulis encrasicolus TaxID=184585 RepID=UPI002FCEDC34